MHVNIITLGKQITYCIGINSIVPSSFQMNGALTANEVSPLPRFGSNGENIDWVAFTSYDSSPGRSERTPKKIDKALSLRSLIIITIIYSCCLTVMVFLWTYLLLRIIAFTMCYEKCAPFSHSAELKQDKYWSKQLLAVSRALDARMNRTPKKSTVQTSE